MKLKTQKGAMLRILQIIKSQTIKNLLSRDAVWCELEAFLIFYEQVITFFKERAVSVFIPCVWLKTNKRVK